MSGSCVEAAAREALGRFPAAAGPGTLNTLANHGGFSGARLWRWQQGTIALCLRAWPAEGTNPEQLAWVHGLMIQARAAGLDFVPRLYPTAQGATHLEHSGRLWELADWMPGTADFNARPTSARLDAACTALGRLHGAWAAGQTATDLCPAIRRRLHAATLWADLLASGWKPGHTSSTSDPALAVALRACSLLRRWLAEVPGLLLPFTDWPLRLQPCLCDVWHEHVLFSGDEVTGLVDYGAVKLEHVAVDLARLLGSLAGDDAALWGAGLDAYTRMRPLSPGEQRLAQALDRTGALIGLASWLDRLYRGDTYVGDRAAAARRFATLVDRVERWR